MNCSSQLEHGSRYHTAAATDAAVAEAAAAPVAPQPSWELQPIRLGLTEQGGEGEPVEAAPAGGVAASCPSVNKNWSVSSTTSTRTNTNQSSTSILCRNSSSNNNCTPHLVLSSYNLSAEPSRTCCHHLPPSPLPPP